MIMSFAPQTLNSHVLRIAAAFSKVALKSLVSVGLIISTSCSMDEEETSDHETPVKEISYENRLFKGIFVTHNSSYRGVVTLNASTPQRTKSSHSAEGMLVLHTGEVIELQSSSTKAQNKTSNYSINFDSDDLSFTFFIDETGAPQTVDVVYKNQEGSIIVAEETETSSVSALTGTYQCTNCENQNSSYQGIELNNEPRAFNLLLASEDGSTSINIQAVMGDLVSAQFAVEENCATNGRYTSCNFRNGTGSTNELYTWDAIHRYATEADEKGEACAGISGNITFYSPDMGIIEAKFTSDKSCPINTYYVSPTGNDNNSGASALDAWQSIEKVNSVDLKPGDIVLFEAGNSYEGNLYFDKNDGNDSSNPVKISSYGPGKATIKAGTGRGIFAYNTAGFIVDNLVIAGSGMSSNTGSGIYFYNDLDGDVKLDHVKITNCEVYGFKNYGIVVGGWNGNSGYKNVLIENNKVYNILDTGISSYGKFSSTKVGYANSNITVRNCEVFNIVGYDKGSHSGNPIMLSDVQHSVIENCVAHSSGMDNASTKGGPVGIWYWDADDVVIQNCEAYNMSGGITNKDGGGFDLDGGVTNGILQYNYSHDNDGSGFLIGQFGGARPMQNITVRFNISQNDAKTNGGSVGLFNGQSTGSMKDIYVYNNTLYTAKAAAIRYITWKPITENVNFYNNILYAVDGAALVVIPEGYKGNFAGNLYYSNTGTKIIYQGSTYSSLESFRTTGNEIYENKNVGYEGNPNVFDAGNGGTIGFGNKLSALAAYKLQLDSPAIDWGVKPNLPLGTRDFYENNLSLDAIPEIGAHGGLTSGKSGELAVK